jgi:hypothetical protein
LLVRSIPRTVFCADIALSPNGTAVTPFRIRLGEKYRLSLQFEREGHSEDELKTLIGFLPASNGAIVPVRWEVTDARTGESVVVGEHKSKGSNSWAGTHVERLLSWVTLPRGVYNFRGEITSDVPLLRSFRAQLCMGFEPSFGQSSRNSAFWMFMFLTGFVALPAAIFSAAVLLVRWIAA